MSHTSPAAETQIYGQLDLHVEIKNVKELFAVAEERLRQIEARLDPVEIAVARIPGIEVRLSRLDRFLLELQGDMRRLEKSSNAHAEKIEGKLDHLRELIIAGQAAD